MKAKPGPKGQTNRSLTGSTGAPKLPAPPKVFSVEQKAYYRRIGLQLTHAGRYVSGMEYHVETLAIALAARDHLAASIQADGWIIDRKPNPAVAMLESQQRTIYQLTNALGLAPRERADRPSKPKAAGAPSALDKALQEQLR